MTSPDELLALAVDQADRRGPAAARRAARVLGSRSTPRRARPTSSPRWTARRSGSSSTGSSPPGPTTASSARRAPIGRRAHRASAGSSTRSTARPTSCTASRASPCRSRPRSTATTVAGVVHDVVHDEVYTATRGGGAWRNGDPDRADGARRSGPGAGRHRLQLPAASGAASRPGARAGRCLGSATSGASAPPRSTSAWWPAAGPTPTTSGVSIRGTGPRAGSSPRRRAPARGDARRRSRPAAVAVRGHPGRVRPAQGVLEEAIAEVGGPARSADCHSDCKRRANHSAQSRARLCRWRSPHSATHPVSPAPGRVQALTVGSTLTLLVHGRLDRTTAGAALHRGGRDGLGARRRPARGRPARRRRVHRRRRRQPGVGARARRHARPRRPLPHDGRRRRRGLSGRVRLPRRRRV